jgi:signal transduction histidine kinase
VIDGSASRAGPARRRDRLATPATALALGAVLVLLAAAYLPITLSATAAQSTGLPGGSILEALVFGGLGVLVAYRRPEQPVGWILVGVGLSLALMADGSQYAVLDYVNHHGQLPLGALAELLDLFWIPGILLMPLGVVHFPDGRLPSARWGVAVRGYTIISAGLVVAFYAVAIVDLTATRISVGPSGGDIAAFDSPSGALAVLYTTWAAVVVVGSVAAVAGLSINYRRSPGERRQQLKWFLLGAAVFLLAGLPTVVLPSSLQSSQVGGVLFDIAFLAVPVTIAVAILKYRLYDVDVVINRALVYGALAVFISAVYIGIAVGLGALVGSGGKPNLGLSILATAIVAVGFQPVRERLQRVANRLVYGRRATPYEVLSQFSERVAESYAIDDVLPRMARVLAEGTGAMRADVWLSSGASLRAAAVWPADARVQDPVAVNGHGIQAPAGADRMVEVRHQGDLLGALSLTKRAGEALTPVEENLLAHLAGQAGLVLKNVGLTADLQARLADLRSSRQRLVSAQDEARRRLERNLHDGAQQHLVAIKVKLGLVDILLGRDPDQATATIGQLKGDADEALETLRDLARGIYPPLLADRGLTAALASQARKASVSVTVDGNGIGRYSEDIEAAVYFAVLEALQNVQKYARASGVLVRLREDAGRLRFSVTDDGGGFDPATVSRGAGLTNMEDRLDALGGELRVTSSPGSGTSVEGWLGIAPMEPVTAGVGSG